MNHDEFSHYDTRSACGGGTDVQMDGQTHGRAALYALHITSRGKSVDKMIQHCSCVIVRRENSERKISLQHLLKTCSGN